MEYLTNLKDNIINYFYSKNEGTYELENIITFVEYKTFMINDNSDTIDKLKELVDRFHTICDNIPNKSIEYLSKLIELNPNEADNYISKGFILVESNNLNEAILNYDKSIEINSNLISSYFNKANLMKQLKHYDEALKLYNIILNETPNDPIVLYNQGLCFLDMNSNDNKALKCFDKSIKYNPKYSNAYYSKGYLLAFKLKKYNQAIDYFNKSIDLR